MNATQKNAIATVPDKAGSIAIYEKIANPMDAMNTLGEAIAQSRLFKCENTAQGRIFALECLTRRCTPLSLARENHVINGNLSQKYDSMLSKFREAGGDYKILTRTENDASIQLQFRGNTITESLTWEEAKQESWPYEKDGTSLKKNWRTPRARRQMLWARVVSEGVRSVCPEVNYGIYTPEESEDFASGGNEKPTSTVVPVENDSATATATTATENQDSEPADGEVIDTEFNVVALEAEAKQESTPTGCSNEQREALRVELSRLQLDETIANAIVEKHGGTTISELRQLTAAQADSLLSDLKAIPPTTSQHESEPCSPVIVGEIKKLVTSKELAEKLKAKLLSSGKKQIAELSQHDAEMLKAALQIGELSLFFERSLHKVVKDDEIPF